nr:glycoside hydrolase family 5 protein [Lachnospiraceae bacterium]
MLGKHGKTLLSGILSFSMLFSGIGAIANNAQVKADVDEGFTEILREDDIDLRFGWNDTSNVGETREITFTDGSTMQAVDNGSMRKDINSQELVDSEMGTGINLGNTLEATYDCAVKNDVTGTGFDTAWGQPVTTQEYIDCIHSYGINTIRIPVAWSNGDIDDGTYTIRPEMLDRVEQIVNYALNNGMYVIINDHWDNQWWGQFGACKYNEDGEKVADEETRKNAWVRYERYWTQIAERFADYSDHLIFEGANEELCERLNDVIVISDGVYKGYCKPDNATDDVISEGGNLTDEEIWNTVNGINQKFVDIIRGFEGNNKNRFLLIPGYGTNIEETCKDSFVMPTDIDENGKDRLLVSVHYYSPTSFALDGGYGYYTEANQTAMAKSFANLEKFSNEGYGVVLGEHGVCNPAGV